MIKYTNCDCFLLAFLVIFLIFYSFTANNNLSLFGNSEPVLPEHYVIWDNDRKPVETCNTCAVVMSSGHLLNSSAGYVIESHDCVIRFNDAPAGQKFSSDVGAKTTFRFAAREGARLLISSAKVNSNAYSNSSNIILLDEACTQKAQLQKLFTRSSFGCLSTKSIGNFLRSGMKHLQQFSHMGGRNKVLTKRRLVATAGQFHQLL